VVKQGGRRGSEEGRKERQGGRGEAGRKDAWTLNI